MKGRRTYRGPGGWTNPWTTRRIHAAAFTVARRMILKAAIDAIADDLRREKVMVSIKNDWDLTGIRRGKL